MPCDLMIKDERIVLSTTKPRILLSSVFGPYAQDDEFGSRSINPMELYHNQVTRSQGAFSLRMFHRSWGLMFLQANISAPSTLLDFPTREGFAKELKAHKYDIVGISSIIVNVGKVREMCRMVRELSPESEIIVGGHVTAIPGIEQMVDADHFVRGEGVQWMRRHLGEDETAPVKHPVIRSGFGFRIFGIDMPERRGSAAATIIPSVGCPMGCNFCTTSAFFGGKGNHIDFFKGGDELFEVMRDMGDKLNTNSFFVMDENFLLNRKRAMQLLARMKQERKSWEFYVFSSANAIRNYTMDELVELGVSWIWMGLESPKSNYIKLANTDTIALTSNLRRHGIRVLGSTIVGLEHHTPENIHEEIEFAVKHATDFHQFMLYTPVPGTPLYREVEEQGRLLDVDLADIHGQFKFNFRHPAISREQSKTFLDYAFPPRLRAQWSERLSHLPHDLRGLAALSRARRCAHPGALREGREDAETDPQQRSVGDGAATRADESGRQQTHRRHSGTSWNAPWGRSRRCRPVCSGRSCCGPRHVKNGVWLRVSPMSRARSSNA